MADSSHTLLNPSDTIQLEGIGPVLLKKSQRARYLRVRVDPKNGVTVIQPIQVSDSHRNRFLEEKKAWIAQALQRQKEARKRLTVFTGDPTYHTRNHTLELSPHPKNTLRASVSKQKIQVWYPAGADVTDIRIQEFVRRAIRSYNFV